MPRPGTWLVLLAAVVALAAVGAAAYLLGRGATAPGIVEGDHVRLEVGDDFLEVSADEPAGTTYVVASGLHRGQTLHPKDGDVVVGEPGAVMSGAELLDPEAFTRDGDVWVLGGREEVPFLHGDTYEGFERDAAQHELWSGPERLRHVASRDAVGAPGEWFFDYDAGEVVVADDPARRDALELSVEEEAITSEADGVEVRDLTVTRYASRTQRGAIQPLGSGWRLDGMQVTGNHGVGVQLADGAVLTNSSITHNGQVGVGGTGGAGITVRDNEIAHNGVLGFEWFFELGGSKFTNTAGAVFSGNWVHDNGGPGIWFDLDTRDITVTDNVAEDNEVMGIFLEVSFGATVTGNTVRGNGFGDDAGSLGAGMSVSNVSDAVVRDNTFTGNATEFTAIHYQRVSDVTGEEFGIHGLEFVDNHVTASAEGAVAFYVDTDEEQLYTDGSVTFDRNTYVLDGCDQCFRWGELVDADGWITTGNDVEGTITTVDEP